MKKTLFKSLVGVSFLFAMFALVTHAQAATTWDVTGAYGINVNYLSVDYPETLILTQVGTNITGVSLDTVPPASLFTITSGSVVGDAINITANQGSLVIDMTGTIALDGTMSGTWTDEAPGTRVGTWASTSGNARAGALSAEDFGVIANYYSGQLGQGLVSGYTAGFGLTDATFTGATSVVMQLFAGTTLLQTNTLNGPNAGSVTGAEISSPFDVSGTFNYALDGYWVNAREAQYGQGVPATRVVLTVTLANGKVVTAENDNLTGDPETIYPGEEVVTSDTCPADTTKSSSPLETLTVDSSSSTAKLSTQSLSIGGSYLLVSSGTWQNSNLNVSDTDYASVDNWTTYMDGYNISPYILGENEFDLQADNAFVDWGSYNTTHSYSHLYTGTGNPVSFLVFDGDSTIPQINQSWYGDNSGSLTVDIYSCEPNVVPPTTGSLTVTKNTVGGDGTFDFTGTPQGFSITTSGSTGSQTINNLTPGAYTILESAADGWNLTSNDCTDVSVVAGQTASCTITNTMLSSISGMKYNDLNRNGKKDANEPGLQGWVIRLLLDDPITNKDTLVTSTTTDASGNYSFTNLPLGIYDVRETHQNGWKRMSKNPKDIIITDSSVITGVDFGNAKIKRGEKEDNNNDDNRDDQTGHFFGNHGWSNYMLDFNKSDHMKFNGHFGFGGNSGFRGNLLSFFKR